jgi:hypothetical protein
MTTLENVLQSKLKDSPVVRIPNLAKRIAVQSCGGILRAEAVCQVVRLRSKLQRLSFPNREYSG